MNHWCGGGFHKDREKDVFRNMVGVEWTKFRKQRNVKPEDKILSPNNYDIDTDIGDRAP